MIKYSFFLKQHYLFYADNVCQKKRDRQKNRRNDLRALYMRKSHRIMEKNAGSELHDEERRTKSIIQENKQNINTLEELRIVLKKTNTQINGLYIYN